MSDARTTAEEMAAAWWATLIPEAVYLELAAHMSDVEIRMLARCRP